MHEEMNSLYKNKTLILVDKPKGVKTVGCKWILKRNEGVPGVEKAWFKAKLVATGFTQMKGVDFNEIFSHVVKHTSIRILLALTGQFI